MLIKIGEEENAIADGNLIVDPKPGESISETVESHSITIKFDWIDDLIFL